MVNKLTSSVRSGSGSASHLLGTSSGFPGAFHRSTVASFSKRLAGSRSSHQHEVDNAIETLDLPHHHSKHQTPYAVADIGSGILPESEGILDMNNRKLSAMSAG